MPIASASLEGWGKNGVSFNYAENYNYSAYTIEQTGESISFTLLDENAVRHLSESQKDLLPKAGINIPKDQKWNQKKLQNALLQGILMGDSIGDLAGRLENVTNMNRNSAIRNARTMVTGAQNGGRQKSYEEAEAMGIKIQKEWMSAKDNRVRDSHAQLNGVRVRYNKTFPNGCRYPGDPSGRPEEVYNCRCTMVAITPNASQKKRTGNTVASYKKWKIQKENDRKVDYMSNSFRPRYGDFEKLNLEGIEINVNKVTNSQFNMVADVNNRRNKAIKFTEKMLREVKKSLPKSFQIPRIVVIDFERYGLNNKAIGGYHNKSGDLYLNSKYDTKQKILDFVNRQEGQFANKTEYAVLLHELGHKNYYDEIKNFTEKQGVSYNKAKKSIDTKIMECIEKNDINLEEAISRYAYEGYESGKYTEIYAECFSVRNTNKIAESIIEMIKE